MKKEDRYIEAEDPEEARRLLDLPLTYPVQFVRAILTSIDRGDGIRVVTKRLLWKASIATAVLFAVIPCTFAQDGGYTIQDQNGTTLVRPNGNDGDYYISGPNSLDFAHRQPDGSYVITGDHGLEFVTPDGE